MIQFALYIVLASCSPLVHGNISRKILKSAEIVKEINNLEFNTWRVRISIKNILSVSLAN